MTTVTVIGDALLDRDWSGTVRRLSPEACPVVEEPEERVRAGGAALAAIASSWWASTTLVTALADDSGGFTLRRLLAAAGVEVIDLGLAGPTPEKWRIRTAAQTVVRLDRACEPVALPGHLTPAARRALRQADAVLVADYGRQLASTGSVGTALHTLAAGRAVVWDPHPRGAEPPRWADLVTPNAREAAQLLGDETAAGDCLPDAARRARRLRDRFATPFAVTAGGAGAALAEGEGPPALVTTRPVQGDSCGAGDVFAARVAVDRARGESRLAAVRAGVAAATTFVQTGSARDDVRTGHPETDAVELARHWREAGGRVVVAGGCFDLLHAGHVALLEGAAALGDCLIVCLNSDSSVRRLKGPSRPIVSEDDRRAVLLGLASVDAVVIFDEATPCRVLEQIRPHLFVKGGDYDGAHLPERGVLQAWGGEVVLLPHVAGRSTSRLLEIAREAS